VEVSHSIHETLSTWGEVCARAGIELGATPAGAPMRRLIGGGMVITARRSANGNGGFASGSAATGGGGCCGGGGCGCH
jgi:hypothetical protein